MFLRPRPEAWAFAGMRRASTRRSLSGDFHSRGSRRLPGESLELGSVVRCRAPGTDALMPDAKWPNQPSRFGFLSCGINRRASNNHKALFWLRALPRSCIRLASPPATSVPSATRVTAA